MENFYGKTEEFRELSFSDTEEFSFSAMGVYCRKPHVWEKSVGRDIWAQSWQSRLFLAFFSVFRI